MYAKLKKKLKYYTTRAIRNTSLIVKPNGQQRQETYAGHSALQRANS